MDHLNIIAVVILVALIGVLFSRQSSKSTLPLPPGPKPLPIIGNTLQAPQQHAWRQYYEWNKQYGPLVYLNVAGTKILLLGNALVAQDLLNKRSATSSNRAPMVMANDLVTKGMHILLRPYDAQYVLHQRMQSSALSLRSANSYVKLYELETLRLLRNIVHGGQEPDFIGLISRCNLAIVYSLIYGLKVSTGEEKFLLESRKVQAAFGPVATPGAYIVDTFPFLNHLPSFLAPWKAEAEKLYAEESALHLSNLDAGLAATGWNFTKQFSSSPEAQKMSRVELAYSLGILLNAGFDTTTMQIEWFIVACIAYPHCLLKAQAELDTLGRLPMLSDRDRLPYVNAMLNECLRWRALMNSGFPHGTTEEMEYQGYRIPKGTLLLPQTWAIDQDPAVYQHPEEFMPERWLPGHQNAGNVPIGTWGWGRRICTGRHIAKNTLFLIVARLMWAFDIKAAEGETVDVDAMDGGFNTKPLPFRARFEVRSGVEEVVEREWLAESGE